MKALLLVVGVICPLPQNDVPRLPTTAQCTVVFQQVNARVCAGPTKVFVQKLGFFEPAAPGKFLGALSKHELVSAENFP